MDVIALWSGGKDSCLACYRALQQGHRVHALVNFTEPATSRSLSHGLPAPLIGEQAALTGIPVVQREASRGAYEGIFKSLVNEWKNKGVRGIVFGDIYLEEHRQWIDRICSELDVTPVYPLWKEDTGKLLADFTGNGFRAAVVCVRKDAMPRQWLGRQIDARFTADLSRELPLVDPCGEKGEFHTLVTSGPLFTKRIMVRDSAERETEDHVFLDIRSWESAP